MIDGLMNLGKNQDPIVEQQHPREILSKPKIQWPNGNQKAV